MAEKNTKKKPIKNGESKSTPRVKKSREKAKVITEGTPFKKASDLTAARERIFKELWEKAESAKVIRELLQQDQYKFLMDPFKKGMSCRFEADKNDVVKVYLDDQDVQIIDINKELKNDKSQEQVIEILVRALSESFQINYLKATGRIFLNEKDGDDSLLSLLKNRDSK